MPASELRPESRYGVQPLGCPGVEPFGLHAPLCRLKPELHACFGAQARIQVWSSAFSCPPESNLRPEVSPFRAAVCAICQRCASEPGRRPLRLSVLIGAVRRDSLAVP